MWVRWVNIHGRVDGWIVREGTRKFRWSACVWWVVDPRDRVIRGRGRKYRRFASAAKAMAWVDKHHPAVP